MDYNLYYEAERKVGGRFKLATMLQKRIVELMRGDHKLVDVQSDNLKEIAVREILAGKIELVLDDASPDAEGDGSVADSFSLFEY